MINFCVQSPLARIHIKIQLPHIASKFYTLHILVFL